MELNYLAVLGCGIVAMVLGFLWYGPLFGTYWLRVIGATEADIAARKEMQKRAIPLYGVTFLLALLQAYILAHFIHAWSDVSGIETALFVFVGFLMPTVASASMWNNDSSKVSWTRFCIQAGYYLVLFVLFGFILGTWG